MSEDRDRSRDRPRRDRPSRFSETSRDRSTDRGRDRGGARSSNRVYVSNIPYEVRWQDIKDLFREQVGDVSYVEMFVEENDKPKGCAIVEFSDPSCVQKCLEVMQRYEVKGRKLVIKEDAGNMRDKHGNVIGGKRARHDNGGGNRYRDDGNSRNNNMGSFQNEAKWGNTYGLSPNFLESLMIDPPLSNRVFVANLEYNIDQKKLKDVFRLAGRVINIDIPIDKEGRSRGFAVVEYDHPVEAVQAISMFHNQYLYERQMTVRMDRVNDSVKLPEGLKTIGMGLGQNGEPLKNVAHNLPGSQSSILGAMPNNAFQVANALSGLNNVSALNNLNPSVLGSGLGPNFLQNGLGGPNNLQSLMAQSQQLSALGSGGGSNGINVVPPPSNNSLSFGSQGSNGYNPNAPVTYPINYMSSSRQSALNLKPAENKTFSKKVLINNLPPTASFKLLKEKFNEFGTVTYWEEKGVGSYLIAYANEWEAEQAIKNLDKARVDGRYIEARPYY